MLAISGLSASAPPSGSSLPMNPRPLEGVQEEFCAVVAGGCVFSAAGVVVDAVGRVVVGAGGTVAVVVRVQVRVGSGSRPWEAGPFDCKVWSDGGGGGFGPCLLREGPGTGFVGGSIAAGC